MTALELFPELENPQCRSTKPKEGRSFTGSYLATCNLWVLWVSCGIFCRFVEAAENPQDKPVIVWTNGGPGCSSVGGGLMTELGPFFAQEDGTLKANPWSWNNVANVIFVEHPVGVGFSYSNDTSFYNDITDADDTADFYTFIQGWYARFPQYLNNPLWITGESYGGHYVPHFLQSIVQGNEAIAAGNGAPGAKTLNAKGMLVGNAWTVAELDNAGAAFYWWSHGLVSDSNYLGIFKACNMSNVGPLRRLSGGKTPFMPALQMSMAALEAAEASGRTFDQSCDYYQNAAMDSFNNVDIYDVYADVCVDSTGTKQLKPQAAAMARAAGLPIPTSSAVQVKAAGDDTTGGTADNAGGCWADYEPCIGGFVNTYLNRPDVQAAIHAKPTKWTDCSNIINYDRTSLLTSMLPVYEDLLTKGLSLLVYSGDVDAIVPVTGTRTWLDALDLPIAEEWRPYFVHQQVGGFVETYKGLTFATVRNAGHLVPGTQPARALHMVKHFINGKKL